VLAYHLLWQAKEANLGRTAEVELAHLLSEGGEGVEADPALARQLYEQAASQGNGQALQALAEAHAPGGWLDADAAKSMAYAQQYAKLLEASAGQGDVGAMLQLASFYSTDGLLGNQPDRRIQWLREAAEAAGIDVQYLAEPASSGTDADSIYTSRSGVATSIVSIPDRYMHSPNQMVSEDDVEAAAELISEFLVRLDEDTEFIPR
jgi:TPR repeat protein